ncbi:MAG: DNA recombination protein RmuC [Gammaproteobacteria bacterium]|nr:DNA recombination protein RmuC [Gammaproteobacteria bacterium]
MLIELTAEALGLATGALILATLLGWLLRHLFARHELQQAAFLLEQTEKLHQQKLEHIENEQRQLSDQFSSLASAALKNNNENFLKLAEQNLKQFHIQADADLNKREKSIENMIKPIRDALDKTEKQIQSVEKDRQEAYGSLKTYIHTMSDTQKQLQAETRNLVQALRRPEVRGQWGEMTLKRLAELAGMVEHCDFEEQVSVKTDAGVLRPDMIVRMPDRREIIVDAKTPLDAYLDAEQAADDATRATHLTRHARHVRERVRELASKAYWTQFKNSPDFVVLFIPGDQFLSAALDKDPDLLEDALKNRVILATPTSLVALLRAIAFGWRQNVLAENAEKIRELGEDLYGRIATFFDHMSHLGSSLSKSVDHFNKSVGSLERQVLPGARKFADMGIEEKKPLKDIDPITATPRLTED